MSWSKRRGPWWSPVRAAATGHRGEEAHERADSSHGGAAGVTVAEESPVVAEGDRSWEEGVAASSQHQLFLSSTSEVHDFVNKYRIKVLRCHIEGSFNTAQRINATVKFRASYGTVLQYSSETFGFLCFIGDSLQHSSETVCSMLHFVLFYSTAVRQWVFNAPYKSTVLQFSLLETVCTVQLRDMRVGAS